MRLTKWGIGRIRQRRGLAQLGVVTWLMSAVALGGMASLNWAPMQDPTQEQDEPPPRGAVQRQEEKVDEGKALLPPGLRGIGRLRGPIQMQFNQQFGGGNSGGISYSRSSSNGVTTTVMTEGDQVLKLEETSDGIFLEIGKSYTRKDIEQLKSTHPELAKALEAFPTVADGNEVELSVRAVKKYEAVNEEDLKEEHPEAYEQYLKLVEMGQGGFRGGFPDGEDFELPGVGEIRAQHERMRQEVEKMLERIR